MKKRVRIFPSSVHLGAMKNKIRGVQLANFDWIVLLDSDNKISEDYIQALSSFWKKNGKQVPPSDKESFSHIYCPTVLLSTVFNYTNACTNVPLVNDAETWNKMIDNTFGDAFLNTGNYVLHKAILAAWEPLSNEAIGEYMDSKVMNKRAIEMGATLACVPEMHYFHRLSKDSLWLTTSEKSIAFNSEKENWVLKEKSFEIQDASWEFY
jgi:hypothetical protein